MAMTFGEIRRKLRLFRYTTYVMRAQVNDHPLHKLGDFSITLGREAFEACEFGLSHVKTWMPELDEYQEVIPGKGQYVRSHMLYRLTKFQDREHFVFKGIPVFLEL